MPFCSSHTRLGHSLSCWQPRHMPVAPQTGLLAMVQSLVAVAVAHSTQVPAAAPVPQRGVAPPRVMHSVSAVQARHMPAATSQMGVVAAHDDSVQPASMLPSRPPSPESMQRLGTPPRLPSRSQ